MNLKSILVVAALVVGGAAIAQGGAKAGGPPQGGPGGRQGGPGGPGGQFRMRTPEERVERLATQLKLNPDQKKKILAIYKANAPKQKALMDDKKMSREDKMKAFEKMRDENNKKLNAILTKDQQKKYAEMRTRRGPGGPGGPGGAPGRGPATGGAKGGTKAGGKG